MEQDSSNHSSRIAKILRRVITRLRAWIKEREKALQEGLHGLTDALKNGTASQLKKFEKIMTWLPEFFEKHGWLDTGVLVGLIAIIIGLVVVARWA